MQALASELVQAVGQWAEANFDVHNPWLGMVEEIGEMSHCILKQQQGIRGYADYNFFRSELIDALGDFGIYAAHYAYKNKLNLFLGSESHAHVDLDLKSQNSLINEILYRLSLMYDCDKEESIQMQYSALLRAVKGMADGYGIDFKTAVLDTWSTVQQRNWRTAPETGTPQAEITEEQQ